MLCSGFLLRELARLAPSCRHFEARRRSALWGQRPGVSLCEATTRRQCGHLAQRRGYPRAGAGRDPACRSSGWRLLALASATPGLEIVGGVLKGWGEADQRSVAVLGVPPNLTAIAEDAFMESEGRFTLRLPGTRDGHHY